MYVAAGGYGKLGVQYFAKKLNSNFSKKWLATHFEMFAVIPRVVVYRCVLCEVRCKIAENGNRCIIHVESAGSETGECVGEMEPVSASL